MELNFCRRCGKPLKNVKAHIYECPGGHTIFANCTPSLGVFFLTSRNEIMLSERAIEPHKGMLDAFAGFIDGEETLEDGLARELREELSLEPGDYEKPSYLTSGIGHYPYKGETLPVLSVFFWTRLKTDEPLKPSDDVAAVKTLPLHDVDMNTLHDDDIRHAVQELQKLFQ